MVHACKVGARRAQTTVLKKKDVFRAWALRRPRSSAARRAAWRRRGRRNGRRSRRQTGGRLPAASAGSERQGGWRGEEKRRRGSSDLQPAYSSASAICWFASGQLPCCPKLPRSAHSQKAKRFRFWHLIVEVVGSALEEDARNGLARRVANEPRVIVAAADIREGPHVGDHAREAADLAGGVPRHGESANSAAGCADDAAAEGVG